MARFPRSVHKIKLIDLNRVLSSPYLGNHSSPRILGNLPIPENSQEIPGEYAIKPWATKASYHIACDLLAFISKVKHQCQWPHYWNIS